MTTEAEGDAANTTPEAASAAPSGDADWKAAAARVRDTSSWIVKAFVAIAGVLIGTGPLLVNLGNLHGFSRICIAVGAAVLALAGIAVVIWLAWISI